LSSLEDPVRAGFCNLIGGIKTPAASKISSCFQVEKARFPRKKALTLSTNSN
jgi:hypothetical protein